MPFISVFERLRKVDFCKFKASFRPGWAVVIPFLKKKEN